jgi:hypothetical protein
MNWHLALTVGQAPHLTQTSVGFGRRPFVVGIGDGTASVMDVIRYAYLDGKPVLLNDREAWWLVDGVWKALHPADAGNDAKLVSEEQFNSMFPSLPQLPSTAFQRH